MIYELPQALEVGGRTRAIRSDFRDVLNILEAFEDPELSDEEKAFVCLYCLYEDFGEIPREKLQEAYEAAVKFIDHGSGGDKPGPRSMDWAQDAPLLFPAVNRVAGFEVRRVEYMHWWTFVGLFMEIRDTTYSTVLSLRQKRARGKKLEKYEKEFWSQNRGICELKRRLTEAEKAEEDALKNLLGG